MPVGEVWGESVGSSVGVLTVSAFHKLRKPALRPFEVLLYGGVG